MVLLIDNYDSFSYNLYQMAGQILPDIRVIRNDTLSVGEIIALKPSHIILSPGPGRPNDAGVCVPLVKELHGTVPVLGVCLGHQAICEAYGAEIDYAKELVHGKSTMIHIANGTPLFRACPPLLKTARYHSLIARRDTLPDELLVIAETDAGEVMGVKHKDAQVYGVQFHPESILTDHGEKIMRNFLSIGGGGVDSSRDTKNI